MRIRAIRSKSMLCLLACAASLAFAKNQKPYQTATLVQMNSVHCGTSEKDAASPLGEIIGTDDHNRKSEEVLCPEYVLQSDTLVYHIRPKDEKHPTLLPVGAQAQFRIEKDKLLLRVNGDDKDRPYTVVSMVPRSAPTSAANRVP